MLSECQGGAHPDSVAALFFAVNPRVNGIPESETPACGYKRRRRVRIG